MDKRSIEEGRRQRELERAERAQRGESVHSTGSAAASRTNASSTAAVAAAPPARGQDYRSAGRRERSPEPYRRPRNGRGEHVDHGMSRGGDAGDQNQEGKGEEEDDGGEEDDDDEPDAMAAMLGFGGFGTTKVSRGL